MPPLTHTVVAASAGATTFGVVALANESSTDLAKTIYNAITGGHYAYAVAIGLVLVVALARRYVSPYWAPLQTDLGGAVLVLGASFGTALAAAITGGGPLTLNMLLGALGLAFTAAGGYAMVKRVLVTPYLVPLSTRAGAWGYLLRAVLWIFDDLTPPETTPDP